MARDRVGIVMRSRPVVVSHVYERGMSRLSEGEASEPATLVR